MDKTDLRLFRENLARTFDLMGSFHKKSLPSEEPARRNARRSLVAACDIEAGVALTADMLTWKRPAAGISPKFIVDVVGRKALRPIQKDGIITWGLLDD
jgi:N-acetylneuraminate synthase